jgi:glycosyltransferase involved in cell wall biosynthesis
MHYSGPGRAIGGVEIVIGDHANLLVKNGHEVHLIYGSGGGIGNENIVNHEISLISTNVPSIKKNQAEILRKFDETNSFKKLKKKIKNELNKIIPELDVCIIHNIPSMPYNFAATAAINEIADEGKSKYIFWLHDSILFRREWKEHIRKFPFTLLHHRNKKVTFVTPTQFRAEQFAHLQIPYDIPSMKVIPNGVDLEEYIKIDQTTKLLMRKIGISFEDFILLAPVRITPRKNIELAIFVVYELKKMMGETRSIRLLITGPPDHHAKKLGVDYLDYLKELIATHGLQNNVFFCSTVISHQREFDDGKINKWSIGDAYNIADLVFVPSKEEGFGLPVIEAGAARKPVFCSRISPFKELIKDDIEGYMFELNEDPKNISFRIYRLLMEDRVEKNFNNVLNRFSWEVIIKEKLIPLL